MNNFIKHVSQWSIPTFFDTLSKSLVMALAAYLLSKEDFGVLTIAMLVFTYHPILQLGITDGLIIKLPGWYAEERLDEIYNSLRISLTYISIIVLFLILIGYFFVLIEKSVSDLYIIALIYTAAVLPYQAFNHYILYNRFVYRFDITLKARTLNFLLRLFLQLPLLWFFGLYGLAVGEFFIYFITLFYIDHLTKNRLSPQIDLKKIRSYLAFGIPIFTVSLTAIPAASLERALAAYIFDLNLIAEIGFMVLVGSILFIISGQVLSLFAQYAREYFTKLKDPVSAFLGFLGFLHLTSFIYLTLGSIFFWLTCSYIIPLFFNEYISVIGLLPLIYLLFLGRTIVSIYISWMLIIGERSKIAYSHLLFCFSTCLLIFFFNLYNEIALREFLQSLLIGINLQIAAITSYSLIRVGLSKYIPMVLLILSFYILPLQTLFILDRVDWIVFSLLNFSLFFIGFLISMKVSFIANQATYFKHILNKNYL